MTQEIAGLLQRKELEFLRIKDIPTNANILGGRIIKVI